jgi:bifunctional DNA-binding transcriptional regulator/antitoxin component of YhaV-PrlF toxin-antitoxin module
MNRTSRVTTRIGKGGYVALPAKYQEALAVKEGDEVILKLIDNEIRITTRLYELRRAQTIVAQYTQHDDSSWSDELIAQRRVENE